MKKLPFLCATILFGNFLFGQSHTLKFGTLVPINNKAITILPTTPSDDGLLLAPKPAGQNIILVGGSMNPLTNDGNNLILSNSNSLTYSGTQAPLLLTPTLPKQKTNSGNSQKSASVNAQSLTANDNNSLTSLTDYGTNNSKSLQSSNNNSNNFQSLVSPSNQVASAPSANVSLEPLTYTAPKAKVQTGVETLDPSRINASLNNNTNSQKAVANSYFKNTPQETLPPRTSVSRTKMPELAPIEGATDATNSSNGYSKNQNSGMPELAPIEGQNNVAAKTNQSLMPELAPLEEEQTEEAKQNNNQNQDLKQENSNRVRGFLIPKGTLLKANETKSYIIKPAAPIKNIVPFKPNDLDELIGTKPSAGGGMGFLADEEEVNNNYVSLTDLVETPIQNNQTQQQLQQAAKNHQHDPNNPCCRVQMNNNTIKKKVVYKKPVYYKKKTYVQQPAVVYAYKQDPVKTQNLERIVYVPVQQTQQESKTVQVYKPQVATQPVQQPAKSQERVVYRDYTNTYTKANPSSQPECNCPGNNQNTGANKDTKKYYNPNNYAAGLNSGPTSGDYPVSGNSSDADMKYTFYVNSRGKYGVSIYNNNCSVLLQQNGKVVEFKVYGDPKTDQPKLNYFGSPESIAGIPIEYNYNRTVHKIGNIKFDYDFEGFFKTVGNSNVFYTSRSTLSKVDNTNVRYDAGGNVTSVDQNSGIVQYNP